MDLPIQKDVPRPYIDGRNDGRREERRRIRRELLDEMKVRERLVHTSITDHSSNGYERMIPAEALLIALNRIVPEEG